MRICRCGKAIPNSIPRCDECQVRYDRDKRHRHKTYNRYKRDQDLQAIYNNPKWNVCKTKTIFRDNGLCQVCLAGKRIREQHVVHHIAPLEDNKAKAYQLNNLICLCESCHQLIHGQYKEPRGKKEVQAFLFSLIE